MHIVRLNETSPTIHNVCPRSSKLTLVKLLCPLRSRYRSMFEAMLCSCSSSPSSEAVVMPRTAQKTRQPFCDPRRKEPFRPHSVWWHGRQHRSTMGRSEVKYYPFAAKAAIENVPELRFAKNIDVRLANGTTEKLRELNDWGLFNLSQDDVLALPSRLCDEFLLLLLLLTCTRDETGCLLLERLTLYVLSTTSHFLCYLLLTHVLTNTTTTTAMTNYSLSPKY